LTGEEQERLTKRYTDSTEAYQLYLKGRYLMNRWTEDAIKSSIGYFRQALDTDPGYALAYVGLADAHYALSNMFVPPSEAIPRVKAAATEALKIDESLGEAHASLGLVKAMYDRDWPAAESEFQRAIELNPGYALVHVWYGFSLVTQERFDEALEEIQRAQELDPLTPLIRAYTAVPLYFAGRYDAAVAELQSLIEMNPGYYLANAFIGLVYEQTGDLDKSIAAFEKASQAEDAPLEALAQLGRAYAVAGRNTEAEQVLEQLTEISRERYVSAYNFAMIHAGLGDKDRAFEGLNRAEEEQSEWLAFLKVDPRLDSLRSDPRFEDLERRIQPTKR
jgi:tetratricopeptide (TPR) repeat protein